MTNDLHLYLQEGDFEKIEAILKRRNEALVNIDVRDGETGNTPLIWAATRGHTRVSYESLSWRLLVLGSQQRAY